MERKSKLKKERKGPQGGRKGKQEKGKEKGGTHKVYKLLKGGDLQKIQGCQSLPNDGEVILPGSSCSMRIQHSQVGGEGGKETLCPYIYRSSTSASVSPTSMRGIVGQLTGGFK